MAEQAELNQLEALLSQPDFVLEPRVLTCLQRYIKAGGQPQNVVEMLSDHYVGYAQMASLVCRWLGSVDDEGGGAPGVASGSDVRTSAEPRDEFYYLKALARQKFDPERFAGVFKAAGSGPPPWLDRLTADRRGRQLIYELSAVHRSCLLLTFAIQKILHQGHEDEVASVGSSLASHFSVFHRLLAARLRAAAMACGGTPAASAGGVGPEVPGGLVGGAAPAGQPGPAASAAAAAAAGTASLPAITRELVDSCALSQHTYLHAQQLLMELGRHRNGAVFRRISQELEAHTAAQQPRVWDMMKWFVPPGSPASWIEAAAHVGKLLAAGPQLSSADLVQLARLYTPEQSGVPSPPLAPIQHPQLLQLLITNIFVPGKVISGELLDAAFRILSLATAGADTAAHYQAADGAAGLDGAGTSSSAPAASAAEVEQRVEETCTALRTALSVAAHTTSKMTAADTTGALEATYHPVACLGLLYYMRYHLSHRDYHQEAASVTATPAYLRLMVTIAGRQPGMLHMVVELLEASLVNLGNQRNETSHTFLDAAVVLMRDCHAVAEVMAMGERWAESADPSLVRFFLFQVLACLCPPYSPSFAAWLLRLMVKSGVRRGRDGTQGTRNAGLLEEFAAATSSVRFIPPLGAKELAFLAELKQSK